MTTARVKLLQTKYEIVIPEGIRYDQFPQRYWPQLLAFERIIFPFMVVQSRIKPTLIMQYQPDMFEAIIVDTKTFHCTLGGLWSLALKGPRGGEISINEWAFNAAEELKNGYRQQYKLNTAKPSRSSQGEYADHAIDAMRYARASRRPY